MIHQAKVSFGFCDFTFTYHVCRVIPHYTPHYRRLGCLDLLDMFPRKHYNTVHDLHTLNTYKLTDLYDAFRARPADAKKGESVAYMRPAVRICVCWLYVICVMVCMLKLK